MANRTIQFTGYAYGDAPVQLNAHINGELVFSGAVDTIAGDIPPLPIDTTNAPTLFSINESTLYPTSYSGAYPMTVSVATGSGVALSKINSNYQSSHLTVTTSFTGSLSGNTLTVNSVTEGEIAVGMIISGTEPGTRHGTVVSGSGTTWTLDHEATVSETTLQGSIIVAGTAGVFGECFNGTPANSENTPDPRSSVQIDGVQQVPPLTPSQGVWTWVIENGSTLSCNLNVSEGSE